MHSLMIKPNKKLTEDRTGGRDLENNEGATAETGPELPDLALRSEQTDPTQGTEQSWEPAAETRNGILNELYDVLFGPSWQMWIGAVMLSLMSISLFIISSPLGSIGGYNTIGQNLLESLGVSFNESAEEGVPAIIDNLYAMLAISVLLGAMGSALISKEFAVKVAPKPELFKGLIGGILMGVGGSIGMGCTISGFYSSLPALSGGGLFFGLGLCVGVYLTLRYLMWESDHLPFMSSGKWNYHLTAKKTEPSWQPMAGIMVLIIGMAMTEMYCPDCHRDIIGFILIGLIVGFILQRSRFCIFQAIREPFLTGDSTQAKAVIIGILVSLVGFTALKWIGSGSENSFIFGNFWIPALVGGTIFGMGMTAAGACSISSTWRAGEGSLKHWLALFGIIISMPLTGEFLKPGFMDSLPGEMAKPVFLPTTFGYAGAITLIVLMMFLWYVIVRWNDHTKAFCIIKILDKKERPSFTKDKVATAIIAVILVLATSLFAVIHYLNDDELSPSEVLYERSKDHLFSGKPTTISAQNLNAMLVDGYFGNDPYIISVRSYESYELGHIPGAMHMDTREIFEEDSLERLPTERLIVVYCDNGHLSSMASTLLSTYGFDSVSLEWGMASWTHNSTIAPNFFDYRSAIEHPLIEGSEPGSFSGDRWALQRVGQCGFEEPILDDENDSSEEEILGKEFLKFFEDVNQSQSTSENDLTITSDALHDVLANGVQNEKPFVLDLRSPPRYEKGHIPGAVNKDLDTMFLDGSFRELPSDRTIVVVADTIQWEGQAAALLGVNGFNTLSLEHAMQSWTTDESVVSNSIFNRFEDSHNLPVTSGKWPGTLSMGEIVGITDHEILLAASQHIIREGTPTVTSSWLYSVLNDSVGSNDPYIISVQDLQQYQVGHIPGAIHVPWTEVLSEEELGILPNDGSEIIVVGSDGYRATQLTVILNMLGFNSFSLEFGMSAWTMNTTVAPLCDSETGCGEISDYPVVNGTSPGQVENGSTDEHSADLYELMEVFAGGGSGEGGSGEESSEFSQYGREWMVIWSSALQLISELESQEISGKAVYYNLIDGYSSNDPILVSVQNETDYENGHIPGAVRVGTTDLLRSEVLSQLPIDREIVFISSTGEEEIVAASVLALLGYQTASLEYGMSSWNYDKNVTADPRVDISVRVNDFPVVNGAESGDWPF